LALVISAPYFRLVLAIAEPPRNQRVLSTRWLVFSHHGLDHAHAAHSKDEKFVCEHVSPNRTVH